MSRTSRLLEMLGLLRTRRTPATALELAQELGVSERSVYRDVETLRLLGAPLDGQAGVGFLLRDGFFLPNFAFSDDELEALVTGSDLGTAESRSLPVPRQRERPCEDPVQPWLTVSDDQCTSACTRVGRIHLRAI